MASSSAYHNPSVEDEDLIDPDDGEFAASCRLMGLLLLGAQAVDCPPRRSPPSLPPTRRRQADQAANVPPPAV